MSWKVIATKTFSKEFKKYKKHSDVVKALDKKIARIKKDPNSIGGYLVGSLHRYKSTRIMKKLRLIFKIEESQLTVLLIGIDHRKFEYSNF